MPKKRKGPNIGRRTRITDRARKKRLARKIQISKKKYVSPPQKCENIESDHRQDDYKYKGHSQYMIQDIYGEQSTSQNKVDLTQNSFENQKLSLTTCSICQKTFIDSNEYQKHMWTHEKLYQCTKCNESFFHFSDLTSHTTLHSGKNSYMCSVCGKVFIKIRDLIRHVRTHNGERPYQCAQCDKAFSMNSDLTIHMRTHTGEKPFKCDECKKSFSLSSTLKAHIRTHTGERPYQCSLCNKAFSISSSLKAHIRTHTGERPYQCSQCDSAYSHSSGLKLHMKKHTRESYYIYSQSDGVRLHHYKTSSSGIISETYSTPNMKDQASEGMVFVPEAYVRKYFVDANIKKEDDSEYLSESNVEVKDEQIDSDNLRVLTCPIKEEPPDSSISDNGNLS